ncbi:hypothetical protein CRUP_011445, partial [Coryphaenoides rupestris]
MALGLLSISLCVGYLGYLHAVKDNTQELYEATDSQGDKYMRRKTSKASQRRVLGERVWSPGAPDDPDPRDHNTSHFPGSVPPHLSCSSSSSSPADHVLNSGVVLFPGAFDQNGCPLVVFPAEGLDRLAQELSKAEVVDFILYFLHSLHNNKKQDPGSLVSVVADLRRAQSSTARFIAETLHLLQ